LPLLCEFQISDFVYVKRRNLDSVLQMPAKREAYRIKDVGSNGTVVLQGKYVEPHWSTMRLTVHHATCLALIPQLMCPCADQSYHMRGRFAGSQMKRTQGCFVMQVGQDGTWLASRHP